MEKVNFIILLLFISFNVLVGVSLLLRACIGFYRAWRPANDAGQVSKAKPKVRRRAWTNAVWRQPQHTAQTT